MGGKRKSLSASGSASILSFFKRVDLAESESQPKRQKADASCATATSSDDLNARRDTRRDVATSLADAGKDEAVMPSNASNLPSIAIQPFAPKERYECPLPRCEFSTPTSFKGLAQHMDLRHASDLRIPKPDCPQQDGTMKIPCPKACGKMFRSYRVAINHAKVEECSAELPGPFICPWSAYVDCKIVCDSPKALANHIRCHADNSRRPYQCCKGCGSFFADLYILSAHEDKCRGKGGKIRPTTFRFPLNAGIDSIPQVILVGRSSSVAPGAWEVGRGNIKSGLPIWAAKALQHYQHFTGDTRPVVLHAGYDVATRDLPAATFSDATSVLKQSQRANKHRAYKFTQAITADMTRAAAMLEQEGLNKLPIVHSVGLDAWACSVKNIKTYIARVPEFTLVIRLSALAYGLTKDHFTLDHGVWWASFPSKLLADVLEGRVHDVATEQLVAAWKRLQELKDQRAGDNAIVNGRNAIDMSLDFSDGA